ncbi:MAG: CarD family transcriptional regulator [Acidobacteria bacterium]|nr:MAG: CarD family transcriptional regulator [Acidobacteriota bacterium]
MRRLTRSPGFAIISAHTQVSRPAIAKGSGEPRRVPLEFKIGDKVIYPNHGLGIIEQIETRPTGEREEEFLRLRIVANDSTVMVPRSNTTSVGLRRVISKKEIEEVYDALKDTKVRVFDDWKGRFQENSDKMRTGSITEVALVFKSLSHLALQKNLSYRERRMLDKAKYLLVSEIAEVERLPADQVEAKLDRAVARGIKQIKDR